jgi:hypothetical protein
LAEEVQENRGSDSRKVALAHVLHTKTTTPQGWIAERPKMGSAANVSQQVRRFEQTPVSEAIPGGKGMAAS